MSEQSEHNTVQSEQGIQEKRFENEVRSRLASLSQLNEAFADQKAKFELLSELTLRVEQQGAELQQREQQIAELETQVTGLIGDVESIKHSFILRASNRLRRMVKGR